MQGAPAININPHLYPALVPSATRDKISWDISYINETCFIVALTSRMDPWPHMVMAGKAISDMGFPIVSKVVTVGSACHVS